MRGWSAFLVLMALGLFQAPAIASPGCAHADAAEHAAQVDTVFRGRALSQAPDQAAPDAFAITTFEVTAPLKMLSRWSHGATIAVRHPIASDGAGGAISYELGAEALVAARVGADGYLYILACDAPHWPENDYRAALRLAPMP